ncbi:MAG: phosphatidylserine decarboxylase [Candidatus Firestonebacteria bacterium]
MKRLPIAEKEIMFPLVLLVIFTLFIWAFTYFLLAWRYAWIGTWATGFCLLMVFVISYFYRDPERKIRLVKGSVLSPADGKIVSIEDGVEVKDLKGKFKKVSIYLSLFNVHIQRMPISGVIEKIKKVKGSFLPAYKSAAGKKNSQNIFVIKGEIPVVVKQIAGFFVQKAIAWVKEGEDLKAGERIGMIRFSSRVEIFLPRNVTLDVVQGMKVFAGKTVIGYMSKDSEESRKSK